MITKPLTVEKLKAIATEMFYNRTRLVTKTGKGSVINAMLYVLAKLAQKIINNIATLETYLFPESATGERLDEIAKLRGVSPRGGATKSSVYLLVIAKSSSDYDEDVSDGVTINTTTRFISNDGVEYSAVNQDPIIIDDGDFKYIRVVSQNSGSNSYSPAYSITSTSQGVNDSIANIQSVFNEYAAYGGKDAESDNLFRQRIKKSMNAFALGTKERMFYHINSVDSRVCRLEFCDFNPNGFPAFYVFSEDGTAFDADTLSRFKTAAQKFISFGAQTPDFINATRTDYEVKVKLRIAKDYETVVGEVLNNATINVIESVNWILPSFSKLEWDNMLQAVKDTDGIAYVYDEEFYLYGAGDELIAEPQKDLMINKYSYPYLSRIVFTDKDGKVIKTKENTSYLSIKDSFTYGSIEYIKDFV